ncbi:MAG: hypothetical protein B7Z55_15485, partial [Planctomycetales bacterium 12-60-4]
DGYAHKLHEQEWLPIAEAGLFGLFLLHIYLAFVTTWENRRARMQSYLVTQSKRDDNTFPAGAPASSWMFVSGALVLGFLILHIIDMKLQLRGDVAYAADEHEAFANTIAVLSNPISRIVYALGTVVLGFHLSHGISSAFQTLGLNHPKYTPLVKFGGWLFALVIAAGFCSLPVVVPMLSQPADAAPAVEQPATVE